MRRLLSLAVITVLVTGVVYAGDEVELTWESTILSQRINPYGIVLSDRPVLFNNLKLTQDKWYLGSWTSVGLDNDQFNQGFEDEFDFYLGWQRQFDCFDCDLRLSYYTLYDLGYSKDDQMAIDGWFNFSQVPVVKPYLAVRYSGNSFDKSLEQGWLGRVGLRCSQPLGFNLGSQRAKLDIDLLGAYCDGVLGRDSGFVYAQLGASMPVKLADNISLTPSFTWQIPSGDQTGGPEDYSDGEETVFGIALRFEF